MNDVLIVTPSRGRPERLDVMVDAWRATGLCSDLAVYLDDDDLSTYAKSDDVFWSRGAQLGLVGSTNALVSAHPGYRYYASLGDDHLPRTHGWDQLLVDAIEATGGTGIAYGDDLLQGKYLPTAPLISADIIEGLGWMGPPQLRHMFIDRFWQALGEELNALVYVPEVVIEHMHPALGKSEVDATYEASNNEAAFNEDHEVFKQYMQHYFTGDVARLRDRLSKNR